jgi:hypothetical protein
MRLLEIAQTDDEMTPIACTLHVISLQENPKYIALSYVWGPPTHTREIYVNDEPFMVLENLWHFLHQARKDRQTCAFWIDAICIDQDSNPERTHQVSMMGRIYSEAELVLAWLGTATRYSAQWERAMKTVPEFRDDNHANFKRWYKVYGPSILDLLNSPYWRRIWIIQEYTLARQTILQCGAHRTTGESLSLLHKTWERYSDTHTIKKRPGFGSSMANVVISQDFMRGGACMPLHIAVAWYGFINPRRECADRRDRVYALLSLCGPRMLPEYSITPDYSISILELYAQFVRKVVDGSELGGKEKATYIISILPYVLMIEGTELEGLDDKTMVILKDYHKRFFDDHDIEPWNTL